ncbi:Fe-Mn family superoxide dismutase, partial [Winogradskyella sp.]
PQNEGGGEPPNGPLAQRINQKYGSLDKFIEKFNAKTAAIQGSGWGWLGYRKEDDELSIVTCSNQDPLIVTGFQPLLGIDVWEHAYYLQYKNVRPDYLKAIWNVVNWKDVEKRFKEASAKEAAAVV